MAQTVLITLTTAGVDVGPFDLYSDVDGYVSAFETGVSRAALVAGYTSYVVPDGTMTIKVQSYGTCNNYLYLVVDGAVTTTTTTSTSSTSTTTSTTTSSLFRVNLYGTNENTPSDSFKLQYSLDGGSTWLSCTPTVNNDTTCRYMSPSGGGSLDVAYGTIVFFRLVDSSIAPIKFDSALGASCPSVVTQNCSVSYIIYTTTSIGFVAVTDAGTGAYTSCP